MGFFIWFLARVLIGCIFWGARGCEGGAGVGEGGGGVGDGGSSVELGFGSGLCAGDGGGIGVAETGGDDETE